MARYVVGVDFGGTHLRAALVKEGGEIVERIKRKTQAHLGPQSVIDRIAEAVNEMCDAAPSEEGPLGVGVIAPGPLDPFKGIVRYTPNLPGWQDVPLADELQKQVNRPVWLGNDANLAALAEHRYGAGRGRSHLVYVTISTGIGGGIIINDRLLLGANGLAAEVGHMQIMPDGPLCGCGNRGCVEAVASGPNIARMARERLLRKGLDTRLAELDRDVATEDVVAAAQEGDKLAVEILESAGEAVGMAIGNLVHILNPERFVIGGGVSNAGDLIMEPMRRSALQHTMPSYHSTFDIVLAELGDNVGLLGAAALAFILADE